MSFLIKWKWDPATCSDGSMDEEKKSCEVWIYCKQSEKLINDVSDNGLIKVDLQEVIKKV